MGLTCWTVERVAGALGRCFGGLFQVISTEVLNAKQVLANGETEAPRG